MPTIHPWILPDTIADFMLVERKNNDKEFYFDSNNIQIYIDSYHKYIQVYTGASNNTVNKIGLAFYIPEMQWGKESLMVYHLRPKRRQ